MKHDRQKKMTRALRGGHKSRFLPVCVAGLLTLLAAPVRAWADMPYREFSSQYVGVAIGRGPLLYDLKPKGFYALGEADPFRVCWFGQYGTEPDLPPFGLDAGDRIFTARTASLNGPVTLWNGGLRVSWKGRAGSTGGEQCDDHLVGSPSVLRLQGKHVMFIEGYSNWMTRLNRLYHAGRRDTWTTNGLVAPNGLPFDYVTGYDMEWPIDQGYAPLLKKANTVPIYSGQVEYLDSAGRVTRVDRLLAKDRAYFTKGPKGERRTLLSSGKPVFWLWNTGSTATHRLLSVYRDPTTKNRYVAESPVQANHSRTEVLGWSSKSLAGTLINRIRMLTSTDGSSYAAVQGPGSGGAILWPENEDCAFYPPAPGDNPHDPSRYYGSGYPIALVRDGYVELYFTDDTDPRVARGAPALWRVRVPVASALNPSAYSNATRQYCGGYYLSDIKWSPSLRRYFAFETRNGQAALRWTAPNPPADQPPSFPEENVYTVSSPSRFIGWGGIIGNDQGQVLEFPGYDVFHLLLEDYPSASAAGSYFNADIGHAVVFGWR